MIRVDGFVSRGVLRSRGCTGKGNKPGQGHVGSHFEHIPYRTLLGSHEGLEGIKAMKGQST